MMNVALVGQEMQNYRWEYKPLSEVAEIHDTRRKPINAKERAKRIEGKDESSLFPYYGATGQVGYIDDYLTDGEYVLLGEDGAPFLDAFVNKAYIITGKAWVNNHAHILRSKGDNRFLCYYLNHFDFHDYVSGTTRLKLTQEQMKKIPVPVLPIEEQQHIVARIEELFSQLDDAEATLQKTKAQLALYRQAVYTSAYKGIEANRSINEFFDITGGITKNSTRGSMQNKRPYLRVANVYYNRLDLSEIKEIGVTDAEIEKCTLMKNDLLFVEGNGSKSQIGRVAIWDGSIPNIVHQNHIIKGRPNGKMFPEFALFYLMSFMGRRQISDVAKSTSGLYTLSTDKVRKLKVPYCQEGEQRRVLSEISSRISICESIEQVVDKAIIQNQSLRMSILTNALKGE